MATSTLRDICFDCADQHRVARFWADTLGYAVRPPDPEDTADDPVALDPVDGGLRLWFNKVPEPKVAKNRAHIDINLPDEGGMGRLLGLGARAARPHPLHPGDPQGLSALGSHDRPPPSHHRPHRRPGK